MQYEIFTIPIVGGGIGAGSGADASLRVLV